VREVAGRFGAAGEAIDLPLAPEALLRRVDWNPPGSWEWNSTAQVNAAPGEPGAWIGRGGGRFAVLRSDSVATAQLAWPIKVRTAQASDSNIELELDTAGLPRGSLLVLQTVAGWQTMLSTDHPLRINLRLPAMPVRPGVARLRTLDDFYGRWNAFLLRSQANVSAGNSENRLLQVEQATLMSQLLAGNWPPQLARDPTQQSASREQLRLGWNGLLDDPQGGRGLSSADGVLYLALPSSVDQGGADAVRAQYWLRYTFPLRANGDRVPEVASSKAGGA
jgi:hypothetical protein